VVHRSAVGPHVGALGALVVQTNPGRDPASQLNNLLIDLSGGDGSQHATCCFARRLGIIPGKGTCVVSESEVSDGDLAQRSLRVGAGVVVPATARGHLHAVLRVPPVVGLTSVPVGVV
ncbi:unnamed protein product, partial [Heterosigma akashiwo]